MCNRQNSWDPSSTDLAVVALALDRAKHVIRLFDVTVATQYFINSVVVLQHR